MKLLQITTSARHSTKYAKKLCLEEFCGLELVIHLAKRAQVMLTSNLWATVGLCNGASGTIVSFIYEENHHLWNYLFQ